MLKFRNDEWTALPPVSLLVLRRSLCRFSLRNSLALSAAALISSGLGVQDSTGIVHAPMTKVIAKNLRTEVKASACGQEYVTLGCASNEEIKSR